MGAPWKFGVEMGSLGKHLLLVRVPLISASN